MFGENTMLGYDCRSIDYKGRLIIPPFANPSSGDQISIIKPLDDEYIKIYRKQIYTQRINNLNNMVNSTTDLIELENIKSQIAKLALEYYNDAIIDNEKRILIPKALREKYDKKVILVGLVDHINIFPNEYVYTKYKEKIPR